MVRRIWMDRVHLALKKRSVLWLSGVRRVGKTSLVKSLAGLKEPVDYHDCELLRVRESLQDPEFFFSRRPGDSIIVLDEIHKLENPAEVLKVAADHFPKLKVIATGSSTLAAKAKFSDTLTDRKTDLWLTPVLVSELGDFSSSIEDRMLYGGLPRFLIEKNQDETDRLDWLEQFWAKDVSELFRIEKRHSFLKFCQLLLAQSGSLFEATAFGTSCEVSRQTIMNYLAALEIVHFAHIIRPFTQKKSQEILTQPKVYGPDTGFVCAFKGIEKIRDTDRGDLLEHLTLNEVHGVLGRKDIVHYWRTKQGHELDFVLCPRQGRDPVAIECKANHRKFDPTALFEFRRLYPAGENWLVCLSLNRVEEAQYKSTNGDAVIVKMIPIEKLAAAILRIQ